MAKILIIDDEKGLCEEFRDIMQEDGHVVEIANNGAEGLQKIQDNDYDIVFVDVLMPRMDGTEVFSRIRQIKKVPVVIMSGFLPPGKGSQMISQGAAAVLRKPLDLKHVQKIIEDVTS